MAIVKILRFVLHFDMEPLFEWGTEEGGEHTLKALPYVAGWFDRGEDIVKTWGLLQWKNQLHVADYKLSAIFQFAKAMPLLLEGIAK